VRAADPRIRPFDAAADAEAVSAVARRCLREVNARDYPPAVIERLCESFSPAGFAARAARRDMFVLETPAGAVAGTVALDGAQLRSLFVDPDLHGRGFGRALTEHVEALAAERGLAWLELGASLYAVGFYARLGYVEAGRETAGEGNVLVRMRKRLR
jgi:GNAT superfamily N-acetyltransferase